MCNEWLGQKKQIVEGEKDATKVKAKKNISPLTPSIKIQDSQKDQYEPDYSHFLSNLSIPKRQDDSEQYNEKDISADAQSSSSSRPFMISTTKNPT